MKQDVVLTQEELQSHLSEQLRFLATSAERYDLGDVAEAKRLAATLRVLLHDGRSWCLLRRLGLLGDFVDTARDVVPNSLVPHCTLVALHLSRDGVRCVPCLDPDYDAGEPKKTRFKKWWSKPVFVDPLGNSLSRADLVLVAANQDGGAHVDPSLDGRYAAVAKKNSLGWVDDSEGRDRAIPIVGFEKAAIRQIAHEVFKTLQPGYEKRHLISDGAVVSNISIVKVSDAPADFSVSVENQTSSSA